jgi:two-component system OmpR family sensor kinase
MYDLDKEYIFGTLSSTHTLDEAVEEHTLHYVVKLEPYYLGAAYLLVQKPIDTDAIRQLQKQILFFMLVAGVFFTTLGYFLGRLFVAPMRDAIEQMNQFIQDTTHELNTPISTILTNVELIESFEQTPTHNRELTRIAIASKTLSRIYDDLTYLNLNHHYHREIQHLNLSTLLHERVLYFSQMAEAKLLNITLEIEEACMQNIDKNDALRLIDNLLSNAIKYNKTQGALHIVLTPEKLSIEDTGVGIKRKDLGKILQRFKRANSSEGGFGIGLHIVSQVCESYGFTLDIESVEHQGTKVVVVWEK